MPWQQSGGAQSAGLSFRSAGTYNIPLNAALSGWRAQISGNGIRVTGSGPFRVTIRIDAAANIQALVRVSGSVTNLLTASLSDPSTTSGQLHLADGSVLELWCTWPSGTNSVAAGANSYVTFEPVGPTTSGGLTIPRSALY
jgi:hypothetical protein